MAVSRCLVGLLLIVFATMNSATYAQDRLPAEILNASVALNASQQRSVTDYVIALVDQLQNGTNDEISRAREKLIDPFNDPNASRIFRTAYSAAISLALPPATESQKLLVRLNAMIVAKYLQDAATVSLVRVGLKDANPAVRYLAGNAAAELGRKLQVQEQRELLQLLSDAFGVETDNIVVEQLLAGIGGLSIPEAGLTLLNGLNRRVAVHAANPELAIEAERVGLARMFSGMLRGIADGGQIPQPFVKQISLVACRYMLLCSELIDTNQINRALLPTYTQMITDVDKMLRWCVTTGMPVPEGTSLPADDVGTLIQNRRWVDVRLRAEEWRRVLQRKPYEFRDADMNIRG